MNGPIFQFGASTKREGSKYRQVQAFLPSWCSREAFVMLMSTLAILSLHCILIGSKNCFQTHVLLLRATQSRVLSCFSSLCFHLVDRCGLCPMCRCHCGHAVKHSTCVHVHVHDSVCVTPFKERCCISPTAGENLNMEPKVDIPWTLIQILFCLVLRITLPWLGPLIYWYWPTFNFLKNWDFHSSQNHSEVKIRIISLFPLMPSDHGSIICGTAVLLKLYLIGRGRNIARGLTAVWSLHPPTCNLLKKYWGT